MAHLFDILQRSLEPRYRLVRELGGGSMSTVYLADDLQRGRQVALKVLHTDYAAGFAGERFLREIEIAARLQHPHIVPLLDSGQVAGALYLVMPFVEGESLRARLARLGRLPIAEVVRILADVADALDYAHRKGIVHRDIKPDNILLVGRHALVADFGVAKAVSAATVEPRHLTANVAIGTPTYMAPEQATADPAQDHRADIYALGVVGYELLTGSPPFEAATAQAVLTAHVLDDPVPVEERRPEIPEVLAGVIGQALAKRPQDRWQSAADVLHQLEPLATPSGGVTPTATAPWHRKAPWVVWFAGVAAGLAALTAAVRFSFDHNQANSVPRVLPQQQVTFMGSLSSAAISPDGGMLAFVSHDGGMDHLMVQDMRGGTPLRLDQGPSIQQLSWSGDGREVRYHISTLESQTLHAIDRLGGSSRLVDSVPWAELSPDGTQLVRFPQGTDRLSVVDMQTRAETVTHVSGFRWHGPPVWSPTGDRVAYSASSPETGRAGVLLYLPGATSIDTVYQGEEPCGSPAWNGAGDVLYILCGRGNLSDLMRVALKPGRGGPDGAARVLADGLPLYVQYDTQLSITANGSRLIYLRTLDWSNLGLLPLDDAAGRGTPRVRTMGTAFYQAARFSPDGRSIASLRRDTDSVSLQLMSLDLRVTRMMGRLLEGGEVAWSPDASVLAVAALGSTDSSGLLMFPVNGGPPVLRTNGGIGGGLTWDVGSDVIMQAAGNRSLTTMDPNTGAYRRFELADTIGWILQPRQSPGGRSVAYAWNRTQGHRGLFVSREGEPARQLVQGLVVPLRWSADGKVIYTTTWPLTPDSIRVQAVPVAGGAPRQLVALDPQIIPLDISPDGRQLLVNMLEATVDAWAIDNPDSAVP